jgi:UDP-glucose 4-epimerase
MSRVLAITGSMGYLAKHIMRKLVDSSLQFDQFIGYDILEEDYNLEIPYIHHKMNILDLSSEILEEYGITDFLHLAWIVKPNHNRLQAYNIDIVGTKHVLAQVNNANVQYFLHASSTLAYGAYPENPIPLTEDNPLRGNQKFHYSYHKKLAEEVLDDFESKSANKMIIGRLRPAAILSSDLKSFVVTIMSKTWRTLFLMPYPIPETVIQFLHLDDATQAFEIMLKNRLQGPFNATPDQGIRVGDIPTILKGRGRRFPLRIMKWIVGVQWKLRLSEVPPSYLDFVAYPFEASNEKLKNYGFKPLFSTEDSLRTLLE